MLPESLKSQLIVMGEPAALIDDYLASAATFSFDGYWEYKRNEEQSFNRQVRWDARHCPDPVPTVSHITGDTIAGLMAHL